MKLTNKPCGKLTLITLSIGILLLPACCAVAAVVPPGTPLADRQEIVRNNNSEPSSLDPHKVESDVEMAIINDCFDGLVSINRRGEVEPRLAERWENKAPDQWIFHLRPGLTWSNGRPLTAHDVVYSWRRLSDPDTASPYASYLASMNVLNAQEIISGKQPAEALGVRALDDRTLHITLSRPVSYFLQMLPVPVLVPIPQETVERFDTKWTQPQNFVGSGAFKITQWVVNEKIVAARNHRYWDDNKTVINKVTYLPLASETAEVNRYKAGEIDITRNVPETLFNALQKELGDQVRVTKTLETYFYEFNTNKPPFDDYRVRLALNLGLDKEIIAGKVMGQGQTPAYAVSPDNIGGITFTPAYYADWPAERRTVEARRLLAEAGFTPSRPLTFTLMYNTSESNQRVAIAASSMWKKNLGVDAKLNAQEWKTLMDTMHSERFDLIRTSWKADYNEPSSYLNNYRTGDSINTSKYSSAQYDRVMENALAAGSVEQARRYYQQAEDILAKESPTIPIYHNVGARLVKPYVGGYAQNRLGFIDTKELYIVRH
ncbi:ABC transporter substrate-binding protein [Sodalis sp. RH21]|uniref:ABC transporter substrate-binding protein n=1 Tax=unclassified Sodalis (in: enterobacteria) TaxID=2636512 RepID=UPI0039B4020E